MSTRAGVRRCDSRERGAAAVEFALVLPFLLMLFCGIIDYGFYFNNSIAARQGVREGARQGVVANFSTTGCTTGSSLQQLACKTDKSIGTINGTTYTKVRLPAAGWKQGEQLLVCSIVQSSSLTGMTPLPASGATKTSTRMSIEVVPTTNVPTSDYAEGPGTLDWTWCS
jgi:Flp pilus assembly protein TadG